MICFLDRDGIINEDYGYVGKIERFKWCEGIFELLTTIKNRGIVSLITNQSSMTGLFSYSDFVDLTFYMIRVR